jgi:hypothetical protein
MDIEKVFRHGVFKMFIGISLVFIYEACTSDPDESERTKTVQLLTNNSNKLWVMEQNLIDNVEQIFSPCDSTYILNILSDFTWKEQYQNISCASINSGSWDLNDENNVLITYYKPFLSQDILERKFEILELTEEVFTYQYASRNSLILVRLIKY